jgi:predicted GIY-YIG superfamily endonuclease
LEGTVAIQHEPLRADDETRLKLLELMEGTARRSKTRPNILYSFKGRDGELLYIGITVDPPMRFRQHRSVKSWWDQVSDIHLEHFDSRSELLEAERAAIEAESPKYNIAYGNGECSCEACAWLDDLEAFTSTDEFRASDLAGIYRAWRAEALKPLTDMVSEALSLRFPELLGDA